MAIPCDLRVKFMQKATKIAGLEENNSLYYLYLYLYETYKYCNNYISRRGLLAQV